MIFLYLDTDFTNFPLIFILPLNKRFYESILPDSKFNIVVFPDPEGPKIAVIVFGLNLPEHYFKIVFRECSRFSFSF